MPELAKPELPHYQPNIGQIALSAFATTAAINARRTQLENQLQQIALRNQALEQQQQLNQEKFGLSAQVADWRHEKDIEALQQGQEKIADLRNKTDAYTRIQDAKTDLMAEQLKLQDAKNRTEVAKLWDQARKERAGFLAQTMNRYNVSEEDINANIWKDVGNGQMEANVAARLPGGRGKQMIVDPTDPKKVIENRYRVQVPKSDLEWMRTTAKDIKTLPVAPFPDNPTPPQAKVKVIAPDGTPGLIPQSQLQDALNSGYTRPE